MGLYLFVFSFTGLFDYDLLVVLLLIVCFVIGVLGIRLLVVLWLVLVCLQLVISFGCLLDVRFYGLFACNLIRLFTCGVVLFCSCFNSVVILLIFCC